MATALTEIFDRHTQQQIQEFENHLYAQLDQDVAEEIIAFADLKTKEKFDAIYNIISDRYQKLTAVYHQMAKAESKEEYQEGLKEYFRLIHPRDVLEDLTAALQFQEIEKDYKGMLEAFSAAHFGELFRRYQWDDDVFRFLQAGLLAQTKDLTDKLEAYAKEIVRHIEFLKKAKNKKLVEGVVQIGGRILASTLVPFGGILAGRAMSLFSSDTQKEIVDSFFIVDEKLNVFTKTLFQFLKEAQIKYTYILLTLYGGTFLQVNKDLEAVHLKIKILNLIANQYELEVVEEERERILEWASKSIAELEHAIRTKQTDAALIASDRFFQFFRHRHYYGLIEKEPNISLMYYANLLKTAALFQLATQHLERNEPGKFAQIMQSYFLHAPMAVTNQDLERLGIKAFVELGLAYVACISRERQESGLRHIADYYLRLVERLDKDELYPGENLSPTLEYFMALCALGLQEAGSYHRILKKFSDLNIKINLPYRYMIYVKYTYQSFNPAKDEHDYFWRALKKHKARAFWHSFGKWAKKLWWIPATAALLVAGAFWVLR